ncbi:hypothetical protein [Bacillus toyonensis]|uniref:hypothetical protein n=1 Tax=Bacillus toyonensis TaxID=155322 RepID=UPI000BF27A32|nr:hypothetical protein [Bacillus toyonensis]PFY80035.1 hypothetical protein COL59_28440 [Bacillus toyonensis]PGE10192.1 hypothetical protein COM54_15480 [Bacillus toyonensis]
MLIYIANEAATDKQSNKMIFEADERQNIINGGNNATVRIEINTGVQDVLTVEISASRNASKKFATEAKLHHLRM